MNRLEDLRSKMDQQWDITERNVLQEQIFAEAYDCVVKLSCSHLPRDCQIQIIQMLMSTPQSLLQKLSTRQNHQHRKGFIVKLLPEAKKVHRQSTVPFERCFSLRTTEVELYNLRQSFRIEFNFTNLANINNQSLLYLISAFGSEQDYEKFITLPSFRPNGNVQNYHH